MHGNEEITNIYIYIYIFLHLNYNKLCINNIKIEKMEDYLFLKNMWIIIHKLASHPNLFEFKFHYTSQFKISHIWDIKEKVTLIISLRA